MTSQRKWMVTAMLKSDILMWCKLLGISVEKWNFHESGRSVTGLQVNRRESKIALSAWPHMLLYKDTISYSFHFESTVYRKEKLRSKKRSPINTMIGETISSLESWKDHHCKCYYSREQDKGYECKRPQIIESMWTTQSPQLLFLRSNLFICL